MPFYLALHHDLQHITLPALQTKALCFWIPVFRASVLRVGLAEKMGPDDQKSQGRMCPWESGELLGVSPLHLIFL